MPHEPTHPASRGPPGRSTAARGRVGRSPPAPFGSPRSPSSKQRCAYGARGILAVPRGAAPRPASPRPPPAPGEDLALGSKRKTPEGAARRGAAPPLNAPLRGAPKSRSPQNGHCRKSRQRHQRALPIGGDHRADLKSAIAALGRKGARMPPTAKTGTPPVDPMPKTENLTIHTRHRKGRRGGAPRRPWARASGAHNQCASGARPDFLNYKN
jgi:hypothetical protein